MTKKKLFLIGATVFCITALLTLVVLSCDLTATVSSVPQSGTAMNTTAARQTSTASATAVSIPVLNYFPERQTIARWASTFDVPEITCYIYLINYGNIIGYYVTNGKPASTQSYLTPSFRESRQGAGEGAVVVNEELPDIDGTYGDNPPGVRFFTASGIAVEWAGQGATYLFSTQRLPINVPELGR